LRAEVANPKGILLPGMYVRVRLEQAETPTGIVVPQQAVQRGSTGDSVMVVDAEGRVSPRPVKVGTAQGGDWVILDGVKTGEMVMVDGFQKLRGAAPVKPVPWQPAGASAPGGAAPAGSGPAGVAAASASR
jgi:membrane fusion protein (multidrug efflux system)